MLVRAMPEAGEVAELVDGLGERAAEEEVAAGSGVRKRGRDAAEGQDAAAAADGCHAGGGLDAVGSEEAVDHGEPPAAVGGRLGGQRLEDGLGAAGRARRVEPLGPDRQERVENDRRGEASLEGRSESLEELDRDRAQG